MHAERRTKSKLKAIDFPGCPLPTICYAKSTWSIRRFLEVGQRFGPLPSVVCPRTVMGGTLTGIRAKAGERSDFGL